MQLHKLHSIGEPAKSLHSEKTKFKNFFFFLNQYLITTEAKKSRTQNIRKDAFRIQKYT